MFRGILPLIIFGLTTVVHADSAVQTDWSGGPHVWGPVIEFGDEFYFDSGVAYNSIPGDIILGLIDDIVGHTVAEGFVDASSVYSEDIDGDGDMDILGAAFEDDDITWWENLDGSGTLWAEHIIDEYFFHTESVYSEDIDGDGDMDVLGASCGDEITWWENSDGSGTSWIEHLVDGDFAGAMSAYSEDINGDGYIDVLGASFSDHEITWWENLDGSGTLWAEHTIDRDFAGAQWVYSEDIDGDGDMDILGAARGINEIAWWENIDGSGTLWLKYVVDTDFANVRCVYSEDIDGDGDMDILGAANGSGIIDDISWWENADGTGTSWVKHIVDGDFWGARSVYSEDMDNDGDMDILGASYNESEIAWWENLDGSGTYLEKHIVDTNFGGAASVYSEDINGDGIMDVLGAARISDFIAWWDVLTYPPEGSLMSSVLDTECSPVWGTIGWSEVVSAETAIGFQVRSSDDPDSSAMGPWSDTLYVPCSLEGILTDGEQYVQYMVILETSDPDFTPTLYDVMLTWNPLGIAGENGPYSFELLPFYPNPTGSAPSVRFGLPEGSAVEFTIFDVSGRLVCVMPSSEYSAGYHSIASDNLSPGIYFCQMRAGEYTATQRFVVIE